MKILRLFDMSCVSRHNTRQNKISYYKKPPLKRVIFPQDDISMHFDCLSVENNSYCNM